MRQEMGKIHPRATLVPEQPKYESRSRRQQERPALVLGRRCRDNDTHVETAAPRLSVAREATLRC